MRVMGTTVVHWVSPIAAWWFQPAQRDNERSEECPHDSLSIKPIIDRDWGRMTDTLIVHVRPQSKR